jgi:peptidoglycan hydrolase CwlO-like protein
MNIEKMIDEVMNGKAIGDVISTVTAMSEMVYFNK